MTSRKRTSVCRQLFPDEATDGDRSTTNDLQTQEVENFSERWNFDVMEERPRPGRYDWQRLNDEPKREEEEEEEEEEKEDDDEGEERLRGESGAEEGTDSQRIIASSAEVESRPAIASTETDSSGAIASSSAASLGVLASTDGASLGVTLRRDAESPSDWPTSSASSDVTWRRSDSVGRRKIASTSTMTSVEESFLSEEIPATSGTATADRNEAGEIRRRQMAIEDYFPSKKFKTSKIPSKDEDDDDEENSSCSNNSVKESP